MRDLPAHEVDQFFITINLSIVLQSKQRLGFDWLKIDTRHMMSINNIPKFETDFVLESSA